MKKKDSFFHGSLKTPQNQVQWRLYGFHIQMNQDQSVEITLSRTKNPQFYINVLRELADARNKKNILLCEVKLSLKTIGLFMQFCSLKSLSKVAFMKAV